MIVSYPEVIIKVNSRDIKEQLGDARGSKTEAGQKGLRKRGLGRKDRKKESMQKVRAERVSWFVQNGC